MSDATWDDTYAPAGDSRVDADLVSAGKRDWSGAARRYGGARWAHFALMPMSGRRRAGITMRLLELP